MVEQVCRSPEAAWVGSDSRVVVLRVGRHDSTPLVLRDSAAAIWLALDDVATVSEVVDEVARTYGVRPAELREDVEAFLQDAVELGIVRIDPGAGRESADPTVPQG